MSPSRRTLLSLVGPAVVPLTGCTRSDGQSDGSPSAAYTTTSSSTPTPSSSTAGDEPLVGGSVAVAPGNTADLPIRITNTSSDAVPAGDTVLSADVRQFLPMERRGNGPRNGWGTYAGETLWLTPNELAPGETIKTVLPVAATTSGLYTVTLDGIMFPSSAGGGATETAHLMVEPVPTDVSMVATVVGVARRPNSRVDVHHKNLQTVACPGGENVATVYVQNRGQTRATETAVTLRLPWSEPISMAVGAVDPGRYTWYQTDVPVPADVPSETTHELAITVSTSTTRQTRTQTLTVDRAACSSSRSETPG